MRRLLYLLMILLVLNGCSTVISERVDDSETEYILRIDEEYSDASYSIDGATYISSSDSNVKIGKAGTYILEGEINGSVIINCSKKEKVQLVLNNVTISSGNFAAIYVMEAESVTITLVEGSVNTLKDESEYVLIDENNVDAIVYSKADLIINGSGALNVSTVNHGIVSKDDLIITDGKISIESAGQGLRGKDRVLISGGSFTISSGKDAIKSDNEEDEYRGYIYISGGDFKITSSADGIYGYNLVRIEGGSFDIETSKSDSATSYKGIKSDKAIEITGGEMTISTYDDAIHSDGSIYISGGDLDITSSDDAIHGETTVTIDDGTIDINAYEGIEGTYITINDGKINIKAADDGINAGQKSNEYTATVEINGGRITIVMGQGDTDGIDSNGYIYINGGTIDITGQSPFDYDKGAELNGGTIIVNGEETDEISNQFMGQGFGGMHDRDEDEEEAEEEWEAPAAAPAPAPDFQVAAEEEILLTEEGLE